MNPNDWADIIAKLIMGDANSREDKAEGIAAALRSEREACAKIAADVLSDRGVPVGIWQAAVRAIREQPNG